MFHRANTHAVVPSNAINKKSPPLIKLFGNINTENPSGVMSGPVVPSL